MIEPGKLKSAIHRCLALELIDDSFAPDIRRLNAIPTGAVRGPDVFSGLYRNRHAASTVECRRRAQTTRGTKDQCAARLFSLLKAQSFIAPLPGCHRPTSVRRTRSTMVGHAGGAPRRGRDLATDCAGGGIGASRRAKM